MIARMDKDVGRIIDLLTSLDLNKDTIVFFYSDNGGISVVPTLFGEAQQEVRERFMYWERPKNELQQAVRWQDWKAFREKPGAKLELYNLAVDPGEQNDVSREHPPIVEMFEDYLTTARTESPNYSN